MNNRELKEKLIKIKTQIERIKDTEWKKKMEIINKNIPNNKNKTYITNLLGEHIDSLSYDSIVYLTNLYNSAKEKGEYIGYAFTQKYYGVIEPQYQKIFEEGLINNGGNDYSSFLTINKSYFEIIYQASVEGYVSSNGITEKEGLYIVKLPVSSITKTNQEKTKPIYKKQNNIHYLLNEYILCYIPHENCKMKIEKKIDNPYYKDEHHYNNEGLIYDFNTGKESIIINNSFEQNQKKTI